MKKLKQIFLLVWDVVFMLVMILALCYHNLIGYGIMQARGQLNIVWNARPVSEIMKDPNFPDSLKQRLQLVQEIRDFAVDSLGIKNSENYTTVFDQHGKPLLWVVTASEPYQLKAKKWHFPLLGAVSYKGFFVKQKGIEEADKLRKAGYDVDFGTVSAWSTLGWLKDPILSNMLTYSPGTLANLIIHELTHGTLYVKNNVTFNENLANFVGDKGALRFLAYKYGKDSKEYQHYLNHKADKKVYDAYILHATSRLDSLYRTFKPNESKAVKDTVKNRFIRQIVAGICQLHLHDQKGYDKISRYALKAKNAYFMDFVRYDAKQNTLDQEYKKRFHSDIRLYLNYLKKKYPSV